MAMEVLKTAAVTYQGSVSNAAAAAPVRKTEAANMQKAEQPDVNKVDMSEKTDNKTEPESSRSAANVAGSSKSAASVAGSSEDEQTSRKNSEKKEKDDDLGGTSYQTSRQLQEAVEKLRKNMLSQTQAVFGIHEGTNRVTIKIIDKESKDVIKEYPPEKALDMIQKVWEMAGIMIDAKG